MALELNFAFFFSHARTHTHIATPLNLGHVYLRTYVSTHSHKFRIFFFAYRSFHAKYVKICTMRKFPAIRYIVSFPQTTKCYCVIAWTAHYLISCRSEHCFFNTSADQSQDKGCSILWFVGGMISVQNHNHCTAFKALYFLMLIKARTKAVVFCGLWEE